MDGFLWSRARVRGRHRVPYYKTSELASFKEHLSELVPPIPRTESALYTVYRLAAIAVFFAIFILEAKKSIFSSEKIMKGEWFLFALLAFIDFARARISHAAASAFAPELSVFLNFVHLSSKDAWIGSVNCRLCPFFPAHKADAKPAVHGPCAHNAFKITSVALGVAGATGVYVVWLHLKGFSNIFRQTGKRICDTSIFAGFWSLSDFSPALS